MKKAIVLMLLLSAALCASRAQAVDGIAISTHKDGPGDAYGVRSDTYGQLVRHDIVAGKVVKSTVIYPEKARGACINHEGNKVAFLKLNAHICVMDIDGGNVRELTNSQNSVTSAMDWPLGDWVYYGVDGAPSYKEDPPPKKTIRRVNVVTGEDQPVGMTQYPIWQLTLAANASKESGRFMVTSKLLDFSNPQPWDNPGRLNCGSVVSPGGHYVSEMAHTHADLYIRRWDDEEPSSQRNMLTQFHVNEWRPAPNDGRSFFYRPRWSVNSEKWIAITHGTDFGAAEDRNMVLYNWMDGEQVQVTENPIRGASDEGEDFWVRGIADDFVPGGFEGEAPLTVNLTSDKLAGKEWQWDFGDKSRKTTAATGSHTYAKAGTYLVAAKLGEQTLQQTVTVLPRRKPRASASLMDSRHVVVSFDEPMQAIDAQITLKSGNTVQAFAFGPLKRRLHLTLAQPLAKSDTIILKGIVDQAQQPNPPYEAKIPIDPPAWPANRDGLAFLWQTRNTDNIHFDPNSDTFLSAGLITEGSARFDRDGAMVLTGGVMCSANAGFGCVKQTQDSHELTVEATITPANDLQGNEQNPSRIIACRPDHYQAWNNGFFALHQERDKLVLYLSDRAQRFELCTLTALEPNHVVFTFTRSKLAAWLNGVKSFETDKVRDLNWQQNGYCAGVHFGSFLFLPGRHTPWQGQIEGVAIFSRAISEQDAANDFAAYTRIMQSRKKVPQIEISARLAAKSKIPTAQEILPYRDALVVNEYDVLKVIRGKYKPSRIRVAEWGMLDARPTPVADVQPGTVAEMVLETYDDNPQLQSQALNDTLDENLDMVLYFDVTPRKADPPRLRRIAVMPREVWTPVGHEMQFTTGGFDQYANPIDAKVQWSVQPGGSINVGTAYGAGQWFSDARQPGNAEIDGTGKFKATAAGTVAVIAVATDDPKVQSKAMVGIGDYPGVNPAKGMPLHLAADSSGGSAFQGDIDRMRVYRSMLTADEIAQHAAGKGLDAKDAELIADWTFDQLDGDAYRNVAGDGLAAKASGEVEHVQEAGGGYIRLTGKGFLEVQSDERLDVSQAITLEAWIRPTGGGCLFAREKVWSWGFRFDAKADGLSLDGMRVNSMDLEAGHRFTAGRWTHVVGVLGPAGQWQLYADGKLLRAYERRAMVIDEGN